MDKQLEFWFEFGSTYSYPTAARIEGLTQARGIALVWRPFLLGPIFGEQGWDDSPFNIYPAKGAYMWRDMERICTALALPFQRPSQFPRNGLLAARIACCFAAEPWLPDFVRSVYEANFVQDKDISHPSVVTSILEQLRLPAAKILEAAQSPESKAKLRAQTEQARSLGIFGAPSFLAAGELFWGNDRLETALDWLQHETT
jgi:2-hydroxychromene-2-carboxylate isomerase